MAEMKIGHGIGLLLAIIGLIAIFLFVLPLGGGILYAILANTVVGFIVIFLVNAIFGLGIAYNLFVFIIVAIFGLLGVAIVILLDLLGVKI
jgi:hypothetical protein